MIEECFQRGINLGGWLSQYEFVAEKPLTEENLRKHLDTFVQEKDIRQISLWQFDHIRLPVSGYLLYDAERECLNGRVLKYIHKCIAWCAKYRLNMVVDLHDTEGNIYGAMDKPMPLFTDSVLRGRFIRIWELLAREFVNVTGVTLAFELLNEISDASGAYPLSDVTGEHYDCSRKKSFQWNQLYKKCVERIRSIDGSRRILVGSNGQNSVVYLKELDILDDPYVFYGFHYYDPQVFTHQQADFSEEMRTFGRIVGYPDDISSFTAHINGHPDWKRKHALVAGETRNDRALMIKLLRHAETFIRETGRELYCGEFGVIAHAPGAAARSWAADLTDILEKNHIGYALWNYKFLDFGLLDLDGKPCSSLLQ